MKNLVSGMMLVEKIYGDLNLLVTTPYGFIAVDADGSCIEFNQENYEKAYIPKNYDDPWTPTEGTEIIFDNKV